MQTLGWLLTRNWVSGDSKVAVPPQFTEGRELGYCRPCFVVQVIRMRAVVLTGYQRQRNFASLLKKVRESGRLRMAEEVC